LRRQRRRHCGFADATARAATSGEPRRARPRRSEERRAETQRFQYLLTGSVDKEQHGFEFRAPSFTARAGSSCPKLEARSWTLQFEFVKRIAIIGSGISGLAV